MVTCCFSLISRYRINQGSRQRNQGFPDTAYRTQTRIRQIHCSAPFMSAFVHRFTCPIFTLSFLTIQKAAVTEREMFFISKVSIQEMTVENNTQPWLSNDGNVRLGFAGWAWTSLAMSLHRIYPTRVTQTLNSSQQSSCRRFLRKNEHKSERALRSKSHKIFLSLTVLLYASQN